MPSRRLLSVLLSANILLLCAAVASAEAPITNWSEDPAPPTLPTKVDPVLHSSQESTEEPSMPAQTELLQVKSKFMALMQAATNTKAAPGSVMETYCVEVNNPDWNTEDALAAWKPDVPGSCWTPLSNLATTICSDTCTNSSVLATLMGGGSSSRTLMGGAMDNIHTSLCEDSCFNPFVRDLLALAKQFTKPECADAFEDEQSTRRRRRKSELIESQEPVQESNEQWVEAKNQQSSRQLMGGGGMGGALSEELVTKLEITFGLLCSKNPDDGEYCLTKFHTLTQQDWDNVPLSVRRSRRRRRKTELAQADKQCDHWDGTLEGTQQAGVQGYAACSGEAGTKECWHDWCNANCETAAGIHPACAVDDASSLTVHTRCACGADDDGVWIWGKNPDGSHSDSSTSANATASLECPIDDSQKSQLASLGCCLGDITMWSAQGGDFPELHVVHHLAEDCGIELVKTPCASDLKSSSVEVTVILSNTTANFKAADVQAAFRAAVASTASGIFSTEVSITDFDDSEVSIDLTAALVEGVTGSVTVDATVTLVGDQAQNQASVKTQVEVASSLQISLNTAATGSNLAGAEVTGVVATAGYSETGSSSSGAAQLQASWLFLCALVLCTATHIQHWS